MEGRRSQRQAKVNTDPPVPLASYGIKIYGRDYQEWPSRYNEIFHTIIGNTCDCSTAEVLHSRYRLALKAMGYETELPSTTDGETCGENIQQAREIQRRAIDLYQQTVGDKDSRGPTEYQWRLDIEDRILGRFDQNSSQEGGQGRVATNSKQESHTKDILAGNIACSPVSMTGIGLRGFEFDHPEASNQQKAAANRSHDVDGSVISSNSIHQRQPTQSPAFDTSQHHNASNYGSQREIRSESISARLPSHTRSSSYCSTSLNEPQRRRYFVSAMDRVILEDDLGIQVYQPEQKPDRIIGLVPCNSAYAYSSGSQREGDIYHQRVRELKLKRDINLSPFSNGDFSALILPFLIFEAKRAYGTFWPELEKQAALPVAKLLRLQLNLQLATGRKQSACSTLVWMFGSIGSEWHVYGCYAVWYKDEKEWRFPKKIVQLASMDIRVEKEAIRLLNIVDCILSWAQIYRQKVIEDIQMIEV